MTNYFDKQGNYINCENLSLAEIYHRAFALGVEFEVKSQLSEVDNLPKVKCEECEFRKFTETFIDGIVDVMNKNGITSVEQLSEILKGGAE